MEYSIEEANTLVSQSGVYSILGAHRRCWKGSRHFTWASAVWLSSPLNQQAGQSVSQALHSTRLGRGGGVAVLGQRGHPTQVYTFFFFFFFFFPPQARNSTDLTSHLAYYKGRKGHWREIIQFSPKGPRRPKCQCHGLWAHSGPSTSSTQQLGWPSYSRCRTKMIFL